MEVKKQKTAQEQKHLLDNHPTIQMFRELFKDRYSVFKLVGGAVVDILEGKEPKDWDFTTMGPEPLLDAGFEHQYTTKTAATYKKENITVQILTTNPNDFEFKISQAQYEITKQKLEIDEQSFKHKTLIPTSFEPQSALNSLRRIPHWIKKGYRIHELTYQSLLNSVAGSKNKMLSS